jgi:hypothetical protein
MKSRSYQITYLYYEPSPSELASPDPRDVVVLPNVQHLLTFLQPTYPDRLYPQCGLRWYTEARCNVRTHQAKGPFNAKLLLANTSIGGVGEGKKHDFSTMGYTAP